MRKILGVALAVGGFVGVAACAGVGGTGGRPAPPPASARPVPSEAFSLLADGTVPWVDEPITDADLYGPPHRRRTPAPGSTACTAGQLTGRLDRWYRPGSSGETPRHGAFSDGDHLIGTVDVRNTSRVECTLQGETSTRLLAGDREVPLLYAQIMSDEAKRRVTVVPPGGRAGLRLDWTGPFCAAVEPPFTLAIGLPHGGGTLRAPVGLHDTPACGRGENINPDITATLAASGFDEAAEPEPPNDSPLTGVTVAVDGPATARPGERLTYHVTITNPTGRPVPLDPCPGYYRELFSQGDLNHEAVNTGQLYRLNCRPVHAIAANRSLRFAMVEQVPATLGAGRELDITWRLMAPRLALDGGHGGVLRINVVQ